MCENLKDNSTQVEVQKKAKLSYYMSDNKKYFVLRQGALRFSHQNQAEKNNPLNIHPTVTRDHSIKPDSNNKQY